MNVHPSVLTKIRAMDYPAARRFLKEFGLTRGEQDQVIRMAKNPLTKSNSGVGSITD